jgi:phospholipase D1/2
MEAQYRSISRGGNSIFARVRAEGYDPNEYVSFWNLRSYDRINNPKSLIKEMEEKSGVTFHEAQVALARIFVGEATDEAGPNEAVYIEKPHDQSTPAQDTNKQKKTAQDRVPLPKTVGDVS